MRSPVWIAPPRLQVLATTKATGILNQIELDEYANFTLRQIEKFKSDPDFYQKFVNAIEQEINTNFPIVRPKPPPFPPYLPLIPKSSH